MTPEQLLYYIQHQTNDSIQNLQLLRYLQSQHEWTPTRSIQAIGRSIRAHANVPTNAESIGPTRTEPIVPTVQTKQLLNQT
jgi:hypothetical protein